MPTIKKVPRPSYCSRPRVRKPTLFIIHATRGHTSLNLQDDATLSWFQNAPNRGGWGSTADVLISADDDFVYEFGDIMHEHSTWSAGYGGLGPAYEYGADECAISIECAQTDAQEPFTDRVLEKLVWYVQTRSRDFKLDIPAYHVTEWSQRRNLPIPTGFIGHDETANGRKLGKSDPGKQFPWAEFLRRVEGAPVSIPKIDIAFAYRVLFAVLGYSSGRKAWSDGSFEVSKSEPLPGGAMVRDTFTLTRVRKVK